MWKGVFFQVPIWLDAKTHLIKMGLVRLLFFFCFIFWNSQSFKSFLRSLSSLSFILLFIASSASSNIFYLWSLTWNLHLFLDYLWDWPHLIKWEQHSKAIRDWPVRWVFKPKSRITKHKQDSCPRRSRFPNR